MRSCHGCKFRLPLKFLEIPEIVIGGCVDLRQPSWWPPPRRWQNREMCTTKPKHQPQFLETYRLESARSLHAVLTATGQFPRPYRPKQLGVVCRLGSFLRPGVCWFGMERSGRFQPIRFEILRLALTIPCTYILGASH